MIPASHIQAWSLHAPWPDSRQIEQDLVISRALCDLFNAPALRGRIAINKLLFARPLRYSEDIDLVQMQAEPIGETVDAIRSALSWLGKCNRELPPGVRFNDEDALAAFGRVWEELIGRIPGEPWKLTDSVLEQLRQERFPGLLRGEDQGKSEPI